MRAATLERPALGFSTLEKILPRAAGEWASCFGCPESFRAPQNTTCNQRLLVDLLFANQLRKQVGDYS